jgi:hypothetical protein
LCLLGACGGRSRTIVEQDDDDTTPQAVAGARASSAGASSVHQGGAASGLPPEKGGAPSTNGGAPASAGSPSASGGSSAQCQNVNCVMPQCDADMKLVTLPGSCCLVCRPACEPEGGCTTPMCGSGTHVGMSTGACCPVCVNDPQVPCDQGQMNYAQVRRQFLDKYQSGCKVDTDCVILAPVNRCENGCGYAAVWYSAADDFTSNLESDANNDCAACTQDAAPPCVPPMTAHCVMGQCSLDSN